MCRVEIDRSKVFDPTRRYGSCCSLDINHNTDSRALGLAEVDLDAVSLENAFHEGEGSLEGFIRRQRLLASGNICLDIATFFTLYRNPQVIPTHWREIVDGRHIWIHFEGVLVYNAVTKMHYSVALFPEGDAWGFGICSLNDVWSRRHKSAILKPT